MLSDPILPSAGKSVISLFRSLRIQSSQRNILSRKQRSLLFFYYYFLSGSSLCQVLSHDFSRFLDTAYVIQRPLISPHFIFLICTLIISIISDEPLFFRGLPFSLNDLAHYGQCSHQPVCFDLHYSNVLR